MPLPEGATTVGEEERVRFMRVLRPEGATTAWFDRLPYVDAHEGAAARGGNNLPVHQHCRGYVHEGAAARGGNNYLPRG